MKQRIGYTAALLALLVALTGCSIPHIRRIEPVPEPTGTELPETEPPETETPETETPETEMPETEAPEPEPALPDNVRVYTEEEFYTPLAERVMTMNLPFVPETMSNIEDGRVLIGSTREDLARADLALVDLETCTVAIGQYPFGDDGDGMYAGYSLFLMNGQPVLFDISRTSLCVLDESLSGGILTRFPDEDLWAYGAELIDGDRLILSDNLPELWCATLTEDGTFAFDPIPLTAPAGYDNIDVTDVVREGLYLVTCFSNDTYDYCSGVYRLSDGTVLLFHGTTLGMSVCRGCLVDSDYRTGEVHLYDPARPESYLSIAMPESCYLSYPDGNAEYLYFLNDTDGNSSILRYDPESGLRLDEISLPVPEDGYAYVYGIRDWAGDAYFLYYQDGESSLCRWEADEESDGRIGFDLLERENGSGENQALIEELYEKYDVTVYTGTDAVRYMVGYAVLPETDETLIHSALVELSEFFSRLPEGFMKEVVSCYSSLDICLTGKIIPELNNRNSISDATAFTTEQSGIELAVFDINQGGLDKTVAHEFMHVFENTAYHLSWETDRDFELFARWNMLNPPDFEYRYIYTDEDGNTYNWDDNGMNGQFWEEGKDPDAIYFVDGYSMTYPTEDMARVFENLATAWKYDLPGYFAGEHMQKKAAYLAACLRDAFSSIGDDTVCIWEEGLDPECTLEWFRENYDLDAWYEEHAKG